jgi:lysozyme
MKPIIDISNWQQPNAINYDLLADSVSGVILRACYGVWKDLSFDTHYNELSRRGVPVGAYHFIVQYRSAEEQANALKQAVDGKQLAMGVWGDVETESGAEKLTRAQVQLFLDKAESKLGKRLGIYTSKWMWQTIMGGNYFNDHPLWVAHYTSGSAPLLPQGTNMWALWQYSSSGHLPGYGGNLDMDRFSGSDADFERWVNPNPVELTDSEKLDLLWKHFRGQLGY